MAKRSREYSRLLSLVFVIQCINDASTNTATAVNISMDIPSGGCGKVWDANVLQHLFMSCVMEPPDTAIRLQLNGLYLNGDYLTPVVFSRW
jgi:hypothetical protein